MLTKQSNLKQLKNTFKRLNDLVDSQKNQTEESLSRTRSIISNTKRGMRMQHEQE